jgi:hypothetical protein
MDAWKRHQIQPGNMVTGVSLILPGTHSCSCIAVVNKRTRMYFGNVWMGIRIGIRIEIENITF